MCEDLQKKHLSLNLNMFLIQNDENLIFFKLENLFKLWRSITSLNIQIFINICISSIVDDYFSSFFFDMNFHFYSSLFCIIQSLLDNFNNLLHISNYCEIYYDMTHIIRDDDVFETCDENRYFECAMIHNIRFMKF
jgi:hypothetical protein